MKENEIRIGSIEGNSYSGKTTLAKELENIYGFSIVWEPSAYTKRFPVFPPESYEEAKQSVDFFVEIEKRRSNDALKLAEQSNIVIMDRSVWTYSAFQYVVMKRMPNVPNSYLYSLDVLQKQIENKQIIAPSALVSLEPKNKEVFERRVLERGRVGIDFLNDWETTTLMEEMLGTIIKCVYSRKSGTTILSSTNIMEIAAETNNFLQQSDYFSNAILAFDELRVLK